MIEYEKLRETVVAGLSEYLGCPVVRSNQNRDMAGSGIVYELHKY